MAVLDIIAICLTIVGAIRGFSQGFIRQLASLLGLVVGLIAAKALYAVVAERIYDFNITHNMTVAQILAFVLIWLVVPILFSIAASLVTKVMEIICLGWLNRLLGAALGAIKYFAIVALLVCVIDFFSSGSGFMNEKAEESTLLQYPMELFTGAVGNYAKQLISD